jgi:hypothetical protein
VGAPTEKLEGLDGVIQRYWTAEQRRHLLNLVRLKYNGWRTAQLLALHICMAFNPCSAAPALVFVLLIKEIHPVLSACPSRQTDHSTPMTILAACNNIYHQSLVSWRTLPNSLAHKDWW